MHNKVVHTVARACQERGLATLRFNYRGVGASAGSYDDGRGETQDALAVVAVGRARWPHGALTLAGFSFGAHGEPARRGRWPRRSRLISVAPAVASAESESIVRPPCPWLIVQGEADEVVDARAVQAFAARFQPPPQLMRAARRGAFLSSAACPTCATPHSSFWPPPEHDRGLGGRRRRSPAKLGLTGLP